MKTARENSEPAAEGNTSKYLFPTSFAQQRLSFLEKLRPGSTAYLIPWALRIQGKLHLAALEASLNEVIKRHEILRTTFSWHAGTPMQVVHASMAIPLAVHDLSDAADAETKALQIAHQESHSPLDLERGPLVRAQLLRLADEDHLLLLTLHHIIFDGWSRRILVRELAASYEAYVAGHAPSMAPPKLQYADYAVWQRERFQGVALEKQLAYWREQLTGIPARLDLATSFPRPLEQTVNGAKLPIVIPQELTEKLKSFTREQGATLFMTVLAAFQILLWRYSHQDDIVVGTPIANRNRAELEEVIGFFANTLVLRTKFSPEMNFKDVVAQLKETTLGAYEHQDLPFEKLVEELRPERNLGQNPLFQVMFSMQNLDRPDFELGGLKLRFMETREVTTKFELSVFLSETRNAIEGRVEYNTDLFDPETIRRMIEHYRMLLRSAVSDPQGKVSELPLLTNVERQQMLLDWNASESNFPRHLRLHELFEQQVARTPDAVACIFQKQQLGYRKLNQRANQLAHYLRQRGVGPEVLVAISVERSLEMLVGILGILKAGGAYVPLDPAYPRERLGYILEDSKAAFLITQESLISGLPQCSAQVIPLDSEWRQIEKQPSQNLPIQAHAENLAYVLFTSGSTGRPKGVALEHRSAATLVQWAETVFTREELAGVLFSTSVCFDLSVFEMFVPLSCGGKIILAQDALQLPSLPARQKVTLLNTVPSAMAELIRSGSVPDSLKVVNLAGEALPPALVEQIYSSTSVEKVYNLYGPTEDTTYSTFTLVPRGASVTIGRPISDTQAYILDSHGNPVPIGVSGELHLAGSGLARGYYGRPDLTAERFIPNPFSPGQSARMYRTGDLCRWLANGEIEYLGRIDHQVKIRGFRIELGEIESALAEHPAVQQVVVAAREDSPGDKRLVAYVVPTPGKHLTITEIRAHLKRTLPDYMLPAGLVELERLPLSPNGKVDQKALPKPAIQASTSLSRMRPRDELEERLVKLWQEIFASQEIGIRDNFFDLGGHSLLAVRLVNEIKNGIGADIPLSALFQEATIEHLANIIRGKATISKAVVQPIQEGGSRPPFFVAVLAGVNALGYVPLAKRLGPEQPVYTLQSPGPGPRATMTSYSAQEYETVAGEYVRAMRTIQAKGPYYLGGTCEGARIAFEMTRILESQGESVKLLAIFDTWVLENSQNRNLWRIYYYSQRLLELWHQPWYAWIRAIRKALRARLLWWTGSKSAPRKSEWLQIYWPGDDFVPHRIDGRIMVFKIPKQPFYYNPDPLLGWGARTKSGVDTYLIPNGRHLLLLREPYVRELAKALSQSLAKCQSALNVLDEPEEKHSESDDVVASAT